MSTRDTAGRMRVAFVWGNMPMQPNDDRSTPLDATKGYHSMVASGWSGYPGFVNNNTGTWDDITVPNVVNLTEAAATTALTAAGLTKGTVTTSSAGATAENDGKVKSQTPAAGSTVNPSGGYNSRAVALVKFAYTAP